jgi:cytochrome bd-type quinol oxidase subunit 1
LKPVEMRTGLYLWSLLSAAIAALSLGPSFAHVLEAAPRLTVWSPELWREATVFNAQFEYFAIVGAPLDVGVIIVLAILAWLLRRQRRPFRLALAATLLYAAALATWFLWVAPANAVLATWTQGPVPADFSAIRDRWETGHLAVAAWKLAGLIALTCGLLSIRREQSAG